MTDAELVARFAARHHVEAELAFEALMQRHGPMVLRVCWDVLGDEHAAEDAFQATFLVLARKVRSLRVKDSLGSWLHGVATRALCDSARRRRHELRLAETRGLDSEVMPERTPFDATAILSEEINQLPERYRAPIVLCYLEAMSYATAAGRLRLTEDAVRGRLARARAQAAEAVGPPRGRCHWCACGRAPEGSRCGPSARSRTSDSPRRFEFRGRQRGVRLHDFPFGGFSWRKDMQDHDPD